MSLAGQGPSARGTPSGSARHTLCSAPTVSCCPAPRLSPNQPSPSCSLPAPSRPLTLPLIRRLICPLYSNTPWLAGPLGTRFTHLWKAEGRTSGSAGTVAIVPLGQNGKGFRGHRCLLPGPSLGGREGRQERSEAHSPCLWLPSPHPLPCSSPGAPSPLTIRDPRLRGQGTPLLALAQLYQVLKAQHGAYAGSIPRVELEEEQQRAGVSPSWPRGPQPPALKEALTVTDFQNTETQGDQEAAKLCCSQGDAPNLVSGGVLLKPLTARGISEYAKSWRCLQLSGPGPTRPYCGSTHTSVTRLSSESPSRASTSTSLSSSVEKLKEEGL